MRKFTQGFHVTRDHVSAPGPCEGGLSLSSVFSQVNKKPIKHCKYGPKRASNRATQWHHQLKKIINF